MSVIKFVALNVISALYFSSLAKGDAGNTWGYQDGIPPAEWPREYRTCGGRHQSPIEIQTKHNTVYISVSSVAPAKWTREYRTRDAPALWSREYRTCGGRHQSPIDIQTKQIRLNQRLGRFDLSDLNNVNNIRLTLENNGHTAEVDVEGLNNRLVVRRGGLPGPYTVKQFHFHWGSQDSRGSEHDINGRFFPMEMHVVTYSQRYRMFEEAKNATGGLAVLSFLFDVRIL
ncbi:unnamed protein product [Mytilus edulis]|uniref:Carbonic anhydrase n=1 Tax=Mytilus edulis TaxID=6550 RepID=A0A8S3RB81_MYTED|nr:unnamed protein product [Mytilus edulis]